MQPSIPPFEFEYQIGESEKCMNDDSFQEEEDFYVHLDNKIKDEPDIITYNDAVGAAVQRWYQQMKYKQIHEKMEKFNEFTRFMCGMEDFDFDIKI